MSECAPHTLAAVSPAAAESAAAVFKALSDPLRVRMLSALATSPHGEACVCDLAELADVAQPTVSHHLKVLRRADLLASDRRGTWVWYRLTPLGRRAAAAAEEIFAQNRKDLK